MSAEWVEECPVCADLGHHVGFVSVETEKVDVPLAEPQTTYRPSRRICECRAGHRFECETLISADLTTRFKLGARAT
jgi:hypothetical protein